MRNGLPLNTTTTSTPHTHACNWQWAQWTNYYWWCKTCLNLILFRRRENQKTKIKLEKNERRDKNRKKQNNNDGTNRERCVWTECCVNLFVDSLRSWSHSVDVGNALNIRLSHALYHRSVWTISHGWMNEYMKSEWIYRKSLSCQVMCKYGPSKPSTPPLPVTPHHPRPTFITFNIVSNFILPAFSNPTGSINRLNILYAINYITNRIASSCVYKSIRILCIYRFFFSLYLDFSIFVDWNKLIKSDDDIVRIIRVHSLLDFVNCFVKCYKRSEMRL